MQQAINYLQQTRPELVQQLKQIMQPEKVGKNPIVTAIGLYNAGKSTLLNMLTDNLQQEVFKTARVRETQILKQLTVNAADYQDTPGLDAEQQDDQTAFDAIVRSDLLLLCHSVSLGELDQPTLDYLQRIKQQSTAPLAERLICVLTKAEDRNSGQSARQQVEQQLQQLCGHAPELFTVSSVSYKRGITEQKPLLVRDSGITELQACLELRLEHQRDRLQQVRAERRQQQALRLMAEVKAELEHQQQIFTQHYTVAEQKFTQVGKTLIRSRDQLRAL